MGYVKNTWVDQDVERPKTYEVTTNQDGSITLTDSFGLVTELGTPVNAVNMNHIEEGIENSATIDLDNLSATGEAKFENRANVDLSNLSMDGESRLNSYLRGIINDGNLDANGHLDLIDAGTSSDTTYEYSEAGNYTITLASAGNYEVSLIGGGGYGAGSWNYPTGVTAGGGSGAGFIGTITLSAGTYTITVGGNTNTGNRDTVLKDSSNNVIIKAGGGGNGSADAWSVSYTGGSGGVLTNNATVVGSPTLSTNGNNGGGAIQSAVQGGDSVYDNTKTGYGAGGGSVWGNNTVYGVAGVPGYFKLKINSVPSTTIDYKVSQANPLTITDFSGKQTTFYSLNTDLATSLADGTYNKFLDENGSELIKNTIYAQLKEPTTPSTNDVWIRTTDKVQSFKYDGADWQSYNKVWLGSVDISSGGASNAVNAELCNNNFNVTTWQLRNYRELVEVYNNGASWYKVYKEYNPSTGAYVGLWCEQGGLKSISGTSGTATVDLLKTMNDTNYSIMTTDAHNSSGSGSSTARSDTLTTSTFQFSWTQKGLSGFYWEVKGYLPTPTT